MTQDSELDGLVRQRIRGLRVARGWSLDDLAARCYLDVTVSRIRRAIGGSTLAAS